MRLEQIGREIRRARMSRSLTQARLAEAADISRTTLNQLENGSVKDLGIRKIEAVLQQLGLELDVTDVSASRKHPDFLRLASTTASVSFKNELKDKELLHALMTGRVPAGRRPHMRMLLEEAPRELLAGLVNQVNRSAPPGKIEKNLEKIAEALGLEVGASRRWQSI